MNKDIEIRFWAKVDKAGPDECWLWTASLCGTGYGQFWVGGRMLKAHRVAYEMVNGPIPAGGGPHGTCVLHRCDNPLCCNPRHLTAGTQAENIADMKAKGRHAHGETSYAKLTVEQVLEIRRDTRVSRVIAADYGVGQQLVSMIKRRQRWSHVA